MYIGSTTSLRVSFSDMELYVDVLNDLILEGTEKGQVQIVPNPNAFAGHEPFFKDVIIVLKDDDSNI